MGFSNKLLVLAKPGKVIYQSEHNAVGRFPEPGDELTAGPSRNFQVFDPLDLLAEVTQHIPQGIEDSARASLEVPTTRIRIPTWSLSAISLVRSPLAHYSPSKLEKQNPYQFSDADAQPRQ